MSKPSVPGRLLPARWIDLGWIDLGWIVLGPIVAVALLATVAVAVMGGLRSPSRNSTAAAAPLLVPAEQSAGASASTVRASGFAPTEFAPVSILCRWLLKRTRAKPILKSNTWRAAAATRYSSLPPTPSSH